MTLLYQIKRKMGCNGGGWFGEWMGRWVGWLVGGWLLHRLIAGDRCGEFSALNEILT